MTQTMEDLKTLRNYALGIVGFSTTISAVLIQVFHTRAEPTILCVIGFALAMFAICFLVNRAEQRQAKALKEHKDESDAAMQEFRDGVFYLKNMALENQRSSLRNEMNSEIYRNPSNHDTILQLAHRYFVEMGGDWVQTDQFLAWAENESEKGRPVHIPIELTQTIAIRKDSHKVNNNKEF